jgi:hypothetical protein
MQHSKTPIQGTITNIREHIYIDILNFYVVYPTNKPITALNVEKLLELADEYQMIELPETGFLRLPQIIGDRNANPPIPPLIPVKKSNWWAGVRSGRYPKSVKLGPRVTAWRVEDIRTLIGQLGVGK